jgi:hypothetical protein
LTLAKTASTSNTSLGTSAAIKTSAGNILQETNIEVVISVEGHVCNKDYQIGPMLDFMIHEDSSQAQVYSST